MPFINSRVSVAMEEQQRETLKKKLGEAIAIIPGKSEEWLMIEFSDKCDLSFRGDRKTPAAFVEVKVFGGIPGNCLDKMTKEICAIYSAELGIASERIYVKYEEVSKWGWNGMNF